MGNRGLGRLARRASHGWPTIRLCALKAQRESLFADAEHLYGQGYRWRMFMMAEKFSRRQLLGSGALLATVLAAGCSAGGEARPSRTAMTVYRDPSCGCCEAWARQARQAGFEAAVVDNQDMAAVKRRLGVPEELASCHTAQVASLVFEGHVPFADIRRFISEPPAGVMGLAVPGMPRGSPGMEMPDGAKDAFDVIAFGPGRQMVFAKHG